MWKSSGSLLFACALASALAANAATAQPATSVARPSLMVQTLNGKTFKLAQQRGKWVVVNFWAMWCAPCAAEMPAISKFVMAHKDVTAIGLAWDADSRAKVLQFVHAHPVAYPLAQVDTERPPADFPAPQALPETYLIAPTGRVAKRFLGPVTAKSLARAIITASAHTAVPARP